MKRAEANGRRLLLGAAWQVCAAWVLSLIFQPAFAGTFFAPRTDYAAVNPNDVAVGDLDGDGHLDLVAPCRTVDSLALFFGKGDGTFQSRRNIATGSEPSGTAIADINGDRKLDVIVAEYASNTFSVMLGNGDRTFGPSMTSGGGPVGPIGVTVGDLNGDGAPDIILAHLIPHGFAVYLGHGDGTFGDPVFYGTSNAPAAKCAVGDVNGDGKLDVVAATADKVWIFVGNGTGTLAVAGNIQETVLPIVGVGVTDVNGDQKLDLVAAKRGVDVWPGNGDATFGALTHYAGPGTAHSQSMAIADFNGDGFLDCAVANPVNGLSFSVFHGKGDGSFGARADFATPSGPLQLAGGDFDEDGRIDIVVGCGPSSVVSVFLNRTMVVDTPHAEAHVFLAQSEPNPASELATIRFSLQDSEEASLRIYDISGRLVRTLMQERVSAGWHAVSWDGRATSGSRSPAGIYLYELHTREGRIVKRMTLLKP